MVEKTMDKYLENNKINLVFDMDDTIYDLMDPFKKAHEKLFGDKVNMDVTRLFKKSRIYSDMILELEKAGKVRKEDAFYQRLRLTYKDAGLKLTKEEGLRFEVEYRRNQTFISIFSFMEEVLNYCKEKNIPTAILTNGEGAGQRRKASALKLERWFLPGHIFPTGEIGWNKPDLRAFKSVEVQMHFHPRQTWYIGDTYESDIAGAFAAGWHTVWLNHRTRPCPETPGKADIEINDGKKLLPLLTQIIRP